MKIMSGRKASFACEVTVVLLVAAGEDAGMQIKKNTTENIQVQWLTKYNAYYLCI